jgi:hypothetical protein
MQNGVLDNRYFFISVDVHVGTFTITGDGDYVVTINYTDKSSNKMATYTSKQMTVDTKIEAPTYTINGTAKTEVGGAYKGDATIGFSFNDQNFDTKNITLTRTRFDTSIPESSMLDGTKSTPSG